MNEPNASSPRTRLVPQGGVTADSDSPAWMVEAHQDLAIRRPQFDPSPGDGDGLDEAGGRERAGRRLPLAVLAVVGLMFAAGFAAVLFLDDDDTTVASADATATTLDATAEASEPVDTGTTGSAIELPDAADLPQGEDEDQMSIRIETPSTDASADSGGIGGATATIRSDGRLYFEGAFRSTEEADRHVARAAEVFGADAIVEDYVIDPQAAVPAAGDVALDKPVLFERGSAEIHPDYIPFLEACGDVLKLNPQITMSISGFTDSTGSEQFNLELSQLRAQAIVDFYRDLDVDDGQLIGAGFGEQADFGDNDTESGRTENRRAMLQLLNVMAEE